MSEKLVVDTTPFRFNVGDTVCQSTAYLNWCASRADAEACVSTYAGKFALLAPTHVGVPVPFKIVERWTQECPGGVQKKYSVAGGSIGKVMICLECELDSYDKVLDNIGGRKTGAGCKVSVSDLDIKWTKDAKDQWTEDQEAKEDGDEPSPSENK